MIIVRMKPMSTELHGVAPLSDLGVLRVTGSDAASFLNSQLTQQMATWAPGQARLAGYCSPKGRLLASFVAWRDAGADEIVLVCSADLAAAMVKRLSMFVLRAKCKVVDASRDWSAHGLCGAAAMHGLAAMPEPWHVAAARDGTVVGLPPAEGVERALLLTPPAAPPPGGPSLDLAAWHWLEAGTGVPRIVAATSEQFVPQMINFEIVGGVDFHKGCYPGQEVVARSQYRGAVKRRLQLFEGDGEAHPGQEILHSDDPSQPAGLVVNAGHVTGRPARVLAEVKLAALGSGTLHAGSLQAPALRRVELPYPLQEPATT